MRTTIIGEYPAGFCGKVRLMPDLPEIKAHCIVDSHMHIQSNRCAPEPLKLNQLKRQNYFQVVRHLLTVTIYSSTGWGGGLGLGGKSEDKIGKKALEECDETYKKVSESTQFARRSHIEKSDTEKEKIFTIMVAQMMDMEYAHLAGYDGQKIYHEEDGECFYFKRKSGLAAENQGKRKRAKAKKLKTWYEQFSTTKQAILGNPWNLLCMHKYEPRRWRMKSGSHPPEKFDYGPWDYPFESVATKAKPGIFVGFKVYPPLGFQPLDPRLPHLWQYSGSKKECFYGKCEDADIPILSHCSPGGMITHEIMYYKEFNTRQQSQYKLEQSNNDSDSEQNDEHVYHSDNKKAILEAEQWFYENHVHPAAWRKVLEKFPKLKLCLAHFGGDLWKKYGSNHEWMNETIRLLTEKDESGNYRFPNVYTDIACWDISIGTVRDALREVLIRVPELKKRLLFGSDWHMIMIVSPFDNYDDYCEKWKRYLDEIDINLWVRISLVNAFEFYGLSNTEKLLQMNAGLKKGIGKVSKTFDNNYKKILEIQKEVDNLKKALEQWDQHE
jgi:predicted TIM-barrel fold metal-dependent hydrolase